MTINAETPWTYDHIDSVVDGMNVSVRSEQIEKSEMASIQNLFFRDGRMEVDTGYGLFLGAVRGVPRAQFQFFKKTGTAENILITDSTVYKETAGSWQYVPTTVSTSMSTAGVATDTSLIVASITGFVNGDFVGVELDDGAQHQTTINGVPAGSTIVITDALPSGAAIGNAVLQAVTLSGTSDNQVSLVVAPAFDYLIFTNGVDIVKYYDGTSVQDVMNLPSSGNTICKVVAIYENHLLLIHTIEGGTALPQRIRWSDTADFTNWTTGNSGFDDRYDSEDFYTASAPLGPYQIIYKERSIVRMEFVGASDKLFNFDTVVSGEGAISVDGVVDIGTEHIFVGNSNVYRYKGGFNVDPVGDKLWNVLFGKDKLVDPNTVFRGSCVYIEELDEVWYFFKDAVGTTYPNNIARLKLENDAWVLRSLPIEISGFGFYQTNDSVTWSELSGSWLAQSFKWGGSATQANSPTTILLSGDQAYEYDYATGDDNGTVIAWSFETKEFYNPQNDFRTNFLDIKAKGAAVLIEYSIDNGTSWDTWANPTLESNYAKYRYYKQVITDRIRFRISGSGPGFGIEWFGLQFMPESLN